MSNFSAWLSCNIVYLPRIDNQAMLRFGMASRSLPITLTAAFHGVAAMVLKGSILSIVMLGAGAASLAFLPLKPGSYVLAAASCRDPALAALFSFDGRQFSYPHATQCRSTIVSREGRLYHVRETCSALGDGSPAAPSTTYTSYRLLSHDRVEVRQAGTAGPRAYRWCAPARAQRSS